MYLIHACCVFRQRMLSMRELHHLASFDGSGEDEDREHTYRLSRDSLSGDSFYDRTPWFRLIGR